MIYLDNAATSLQKPNAVRRAVLRAMSRCGNPGRGGHKAALEADREVYRCRETAARFFGLQDPAQVVFTMNATHALNLAIHSLSKPGIHGVTSGYEHNSAIRPLESRKACQLRYTAAHSRLFDQKDALERLQEALQPDTGLAVYTAVSNVFGSRLPFEQIDELCARRGIPLVLDWSQAAGVIPLDCSRLKSRCFVCMPGHKGLYGPQGTGILLCVNGVKPVSLLQGGTGSNSLELQQPDFLPDMLESGTQNVPGIAGLRAGLEFLEQVGIGPIGAREAALTNYTAQRLAAIPGVTVYSGPEQTGVLSFTVKGIDPSALCQLLGERGICLRGGLHCAPLAHRSAGTLPQGTARISFSAFSTAKDADRFLLELRQTLNGFDIRRKTEICY